MTLDKLQVDQEATIVSVPHDAGRLSELGFFPGNKITTCSLGNPLIVKVFGTKFCLRKQVAKQIFVDLT